MDELLNKIYHNWSADKDIPQIPEGFSLPVDIANHLENGIPLLDRQIKRLREKIREFSQRRVKEQDKLNEPDEREIGYTYTGEDEQFSFGLFDEHIGVSNMNLEYRNGYSRQVPLSLSANLQNEVLNYIKKGISSTRVICELLIKNHEAYPKRYTTGKPKIYVLVCFYLDSLVQEDVLRIEVVDVVDRVYHLRDMNIT